MAFFACFFVALGSLLPQLTSSESTARAAPATPSETIKTLSVKVQRLQTAVSGLKIAVNQTLTRRLRALDYQLATVCSQRTVVTRILSPLVIRKWKEGFERKAEALVDQLLEQREFDGVEDCAERFVLAVCQLDHQLFVGR